MQCNSTFRAQQIGNVFDATHSKRVAQNFKLTKRGLMRLLDSRVSFQDTSLVLQICGQTILRLRRDCVLDRPPKLFATAAAFGRVGHYAVVVEHACNALQIISQLVVRKLIGFCGNN